MVNQLRTADTVLARFAINTKVEGGDKFKMLVSLPKPFPQELSVVALLVHS